MSERIEFGIISLGVMGQRMLARLVEHARVQVRSLGSESDSRGKRAAAESRPQDRSDAGRWLAARAEGALFAPGAFASPLRPAA